jgi:Fe-S-cluster containining protein
MPDLPFLLPPDLDFECTSCGRCCRDKWEIRVDAPSAEKLLALDWGKRDPALAGVVPFKKRLPLAPLAGELPYTVERCANNACVFLTENNLCRIHRDMGLEAKPQVCQQFPYLFAETPDGVSVGLSHYCPGVKRKADAQVPPLERKLDELRRLHAHAIRLEKAPEQILVDEGLPLRFEDYKAVEGLVVELVSAPAVTPAVGLAATAVVTSMLVEFLGIRALGKTEPPAGAGREFVDGWRRMGVPRILSIAARQHRAPRTGRLLLRQFLSLVDQAQPGSGSAPVRAFAGAWAFVKELLGVGSIYCAPLAASVSVRAVRAVALPWDSELSRPFRLYAEHAIFRRRLLPPLGLRVGLGLLVLHVAAARFVARAQAALAGRTSATEEDVHRGIELVEKHYAAHSSLGDAFLRGPARGLFRKVAARPRYAAAVLNA